MVLMIIILLAVLADIGLTLALYKRMTRRDAEAALDEQVEQMMKKERDMMSEGLDNIMMFSVNGKTGMEPKNWQGV